MTRPILSRRYFMQASVASVAVPHLGNAQSQDQEPEGGIGGTGIVGVLTNFGSLIVGGNRIETTAETRFSNAFGPIEESDLKIGDALTVEAVGPAAALKAVRVHATHPLVGRITNVSPSGREIIVNQTRVVLENGQNPFELGTRVLVSGLWNGTSVFATRVAEANTGLDLISGTVDRRGRTTKIGPLTIRGRGARGLSDGSFATVIGQYDRVAGQFSARDAIAGRFVFRNIPLRRLVVEGYLEPSREAPGLRVAGLGHSFARNLRLAEFSNNRVLFAGRYTGLFKAETAIVLPDGVEERRRALLQMSR